MSQCTPCENIGVCNDSPLSITGNVVGILTFINAIPVTVAIYTSRLKSAGYGQEQLKASAYANVKRFEQMRSRYDSEGRAISTMDPDLADLMQFGVEEGRRAMISIARGIKFDPGSGRSSRLRQRGRYVPSQAQLTEQRQKLEVAVSLVSTLLDEVSQEIGVPPKPIAETTWEKRAPAEEALDWDPLATVVRPPETQEAERPGPSGQAAPLVGQPVQDTNAASARLVGQQLAPGVQAEELADEVISLASSFQRFRFGRVIASTLWPDVE